LTAARPVGLIGLGAMGQGVAGSLLRAGFAVHGCDVQAAAREALVRAGGAACATPRAVAEACDVLIVLVVDAAQAEAVLFGPAGAVEALRPGSVVVAAATMPPAFVEALGERLDRHGVLLLDCPVTGGVTGAAEGRITLLTSGPAAAYAACEDVLAAISARVFRFGAEPGLGSRVKVANQLLVGVQIAAAAEALALGVRAGVDAQLLHEALCSGAAHSWALADRGPRMAAGDFAPRTALDIFVKDLGLVLSAARDASQPTPLAAAAYQLFADAAAAGLGREDDSAVIKMLSRPRAGEPAT
jgi:3-hydroxyisobutyrate dehydrogenase